MDKPPFRLSNWPWVESGSIAGSALARVAIASRDWRISLDRKWTSKRCCGTWRPTARGSDGGLGNTSPAVASASPIGKGETRARYAVVAATCGGLALACPYPRRSSWPDAGDRLSALQSPRRSERGAAHCLAWRRHASTFRPIPRRQRLSRPARDHASMPSGVRKTDRAARLRRPTGLTSPSPSCTTVSEPHRISSQVASPAPLVPAYLERGRDFATRDANYGRCWPWIIQPRA